MSPADARPAAKAAGYDVIVVGARCAGAATAMLLARRGLRVLVLDRGRRGADTVSTHALMRTGVLQLARWGLLETIRAAGTPPVRTVAFQYGAEVTRLPVEPGAGVDALYAPRRTVLDSVLVEAAERAGAEVRYGQSVTGLIRGDGGRVDGVTAVDRMGRRIQIRAALTIGADGIRSTVATAVEAPVTRRGVHRAAALYGYWDDLPVDGFEFFYQPGLAAGFIPTNDDQTCVFVSTTPERLEQLRRLGTAAAFWSLVRGADPAVQQRLFDADAPERLRGFAGAVGFTRRPHGSGWALVGDAGYFKDPLAAQGIGDALRDAELLARAVTSPGWNGLNGALARYEDDRDSLSDRVLADADRLASFDWTLTEARTLLTDIGSAAAADVASMASADALAGSRD